jgi:hypothetical protein
MRNGLRVLIFTAVVGGSVLAWQHAPEALASSALFQVSEIRFEGARYLDGNDALPIATLPEGFSVWSDLESVAGRVRAHPLVAEARVRRRLPSTLVVEVREREPVGLLPTPTLVPVDAEGRRLPIDPALHRLDLPLLRPRAEPVPPGSPSQGPGAVPPAGAPAGEEGLTPAQLRILAGEVARLTHLEPVLWTTVSEASLDPWGDVVIRIAEPRTAFHFRPPLTAGRLHEGLRVLADALDREPGRTPAAIDLRFADQVVVRYSPSSSR